MIVLDSSFLVAFHNSTDVHHTPAAALMDHLLDGDYGRLILLEYVFLEVVTVIRLRQSLRSALSAADLLLNAAEVDFVTCSEFFMETLGTFRQQKAQELSFVDCAILVYARREVPGFVATFDRSLAACEGIEIPT